MKARYLIIITQAKEGEVDLKVARISQVKKIKLIMVIKKTTLLQKLKMLV